MTTSQKATTAAFSKLNLIIEITVQFVLEGLGMVNVGIFNEHYEYFTASLYILQPFGIVCGQLLINVLPIEIWQPCFTRHHPGKHVDGCVSKYIHLCMYV
jgi:hypothetical protein